MLKERLPDIEELDLNNSSRLCPMLPGPAMVNGDRLTVRLADGDISINAPRALLKKIFALCDGTRSIDELMQTISNAQEQERLRRFIDFLLESGALIDACHYAFTASRFAWGNNPFGQAAEHSLSDQIGGRFAVVSHQPPTTHTYHVSSPPLEKSFAGRVSTYTFDDRPVALADLNTLLWSVAGIVSERRERNGTIVPRRTLASAGAMHLLEVYVALQRQINAPNGEPLAPGIYRVRYPGECLVQYELVGSDIPLLPRAVAKPWCLSFATGMIFLAADARLAGLRYRNRSVQYLFTEAGMALQNAALTAPEVGFGFVSFGSYYEAVVRQLCGLSDHLILGSAIFGPTPTAEQLELTATCPQIEFAWADAPSEHFTLPYFVGRVHLKGAPPDHPTWGRDADPGLACRKAIAETIERQGYQEPRNLQAAAFEELDNALDPRLVARFSQAQYRTPGFRCKPFDPNASYLWATGTEYESGNQVPILADLVYSASSLQQGYDYDASYWVSNSSGCAAGTTIADARLAALLELIERDAFMRHWFMQAPGIGIVPDSLPADLRNRVRAIAETGFQIMVQTLPSPWAPVAFLFAQHPALRVACVSAGARLRLEDAMNSALVELESRVFSLLNGFHIPKLKPRDVAMPDDHFKLYARAPYFKRADRLFTPSSQVRFDTASKNNLSSSQHLFDRMLATGLTPVFVDITPRLSGIRDGRERLVATRAFAPGLLPMSFGFGMEPRGMVNEIHPDSLFPHPFP